MKKMTTLLAGCDLNSHVAQLYTNSVRMNPWYEHEVKRARAEWVAFRRSHGYKGYAPLFTYPEVQKKLGKTAEYNIGLTLQHANVSGIETCQWRTKSCTAVCVLDNGNGRYSSVQKARNVRTWFLAHSPFSFVTLLFDEVSRVSHEHDRVLVRMNVNSDIPWHEVMPEFFSQCWPNVDFYDYTKNPAVLRTNGWVADRYRLVFSLSERIRTDAQMAEVYDFIDEGGTVAVVTVRKKNEPAVYETCSRDVVDGDKTDNRYDECGAFVDLYAKGKARNLKVGGFVRDLGKM